MTTKHFLFAGRGLLIFLLSPGLRAGAFGGGDGLFQPYMVYAAPDGQGVGIGDFNNDGLNDVALTIPYPSFKLYIFCQQPNGLLADPIILDTAPQPDNLAVGDFNSDGRDDIAVVIKNPEVTENYVGVFLQKLDHTLADQVLYSTGDGPDAIAVGDFNNDGRTDIAVPHWLESYIGVFLQTASGAFSEMSTYPSHKAGWDDIAAGDLNNDGLTDVVKMNGQGYENPHFSVFLQQSDGGLAPKVDYNLDFTANVNNIAVGDVTGDGLDDVVLTCGGTRPYSKLAIVSQTGEGTLLQTATYDTYDVPETVTAADVNLDGRLDVVILHGGWMKVGVFLQLNNGTLAPEQLYTITYASHYSPQGLDVGDINNDGWPDLVIADYNYGLVVLYNVGGPLPFPSPSPTPRPALVLDSGDYNGDGTADIAVFRPSLGLWAVRRVTRVYFGNWRDTPVPGDYSGDGTGNIAVFRPGTGLWAAKGVTRTYFGSSSDTAVPIQFNPSSACSIGIFRSTSGLWALKGVTRTYFGGSGDSPIPGDYDGDGTKDLGIFRRSSGLWALKGVSRIYFGSSADTTVPGDYSGDGTWAPAIFRSSSGLWAVKGVTRAYFGASSDLPVPGGYKGDGKDYPGIFRGTSGLWAIKGVTRTYFGSGSDIPVTR